MASFSGLIEEIPEIYVDNFACKTKEAYFLSHAHKDHIDRLYNNFDGKGCSIQENGGKIYMTEETKTVMRYIIQEWYDRYRSWNYLDISESMEPLKTGMTYTIELASNKSFEVTLIPVTHMIGAVMFLFKTDEKRVLFTGDFYIEEDQLHELIELHHEGTPLAIDAMYIDRTFAGEHRHFPKRKSAIKETTDIIEQWLKQPGNGVTLCQSYLMGYEDLHRSIFMGTGIKLYSCDDAMVSLYSDLYGDDSPLTHQPSQIHIMRLKKDANRSCEGICNADVNLNYLYIDICARRGCFYEPGEAAVSEISTNHLYLCFTTHCSQAQREAFEAHFYSPKVVGFPTQPFAAPSREQSKIVCPYRDKRDSERELRELFSRLAFGREQEENVHE